MDSVRIALGAQGQDILRLVAGQGLLLALGGLTIGIAGALLLTRLLSDMRYGVTAADPARTLSYLSRLPRSRFWRHLFLRAAR